MDSTLLAILRCPRTRQPLRQATPEELAAARAQVAADDALVTADGALTYPISDGIICLLPDSGIGARPNGDASTAARTKRDVQGFYDQIGWQASADGTFEDASRWEDLRPVARDYIHECHLRVNRHLRRPGKFLLDVASGPVQYPEYLSYAEGYERRICMDISRAALTQAKKKLGDRGVYVLGDITRLPLADDSIDGLVSLHTIYHVPADEQERAFRELGRVLKPGHSGVVVYAWGEHAPVTKAARLPLLPVVYAMRAVRKLRPRADSLYYHPQPRRWFESRDWPFRYRILVWRSLQPELSRAIVHGAAGRAALRSLARAEERWPELFGRVGQYPLIVMEK